MSNVCIYNGLSNTYWYGPRTSRVDIEAETVTKNGETVYVVKITAWPSSKDSHSKVFHDRVELELTSTNPSIFDAFPNAKHASPINANYTAPAAKEESNV